MRANAVKRQLQSGQPALGTWLSIADATSAELMAAIGWDWLVIDMEHGPITLDDAGALVTAVRASGGTPFVRAAWNESSQIQRALDLGAYGILVPVVNTPEDARAVTRDARFPPLGARSRGGVRAPLAFGTDGNTYRERANDEILVFVQIETNEAVANAVAIAAVDGIDGLVVGPNDLAASSGKRWPDVWGRDAAYMETIASIPRIAARCREDRRHHGSRPRDGKAGDRDGLSFRGHRRRRHVPPKRCKRGAREHAAPPGEPQ